MKMQGAEEKERKLHREAENKAEEKVWKDEE